MTRFNALLLVSILSLGTGGTATSALAAGGHDHDKVHTVVVTGSLHTNPDPAPRTTLCDAQGFGPGNSIYSGTSTYVGIFEGEGEFCGYAGVPNPDGSLPFVETDTFTGTVHGCGAGSVIYNVHGFIYPLKTEPTTGRIPAEEDWNILAQSATGDLTGIESGSGHDHANINPDQTIEADFTGTVTCVPPASAGKARESAQGAKGHGEADGVTIVRGNWLGDLACAPTSAAPQPDLSVHVTCLAGTGYAGAFTGHSYLTMTGDLAADGSFKANYEESIYALYLGDSSYGSLHVVGALSVDTQLGFHARGRITEGTCGFSGSTGTITYEGTAAGGGFVAEWHRPSAGPSTAPCVPPPPNAPRSDALPARALN